ncbi:cytochrome b5 [Tremella mesenterica]|uniref:Cytochrome b5 n=1 Tax=Tremella mesenterica TaxID=5217 RepID=A0A4Q1BLX5_TREME|nr:uncharacterized protein TREMEDRAFT_44321 [Tremella mesenterica DSM 1558]EIW69133.1 hypothetical protein TREMEDRAFT_44321 [Tremella mesenterica DSM 1558]RXK38809.1 cytochrome b5 [Tremella mesenterica]
MASQIPVSAPPSGGTDTDGAIKTYTMEQLKEHGSKESLWMLLHDKVYDVTRFMDEHPGGDEVMLEEAGRDATEAFEDVGHSDEARSMLPKMLLGDFQGQKTSKKKTDPYPTAAKTIQSEKSKITWLIPVAVVGAYLAWRVFLA